MWFQLFGVGAGNMVYCSTPLTHHPRTNIKSKYKTSNSPSLMVCVCMLSIQHASLFWPWCMSLVLFSPSSPVTNTSPYCICHCKNVASLYARTWETKTGCCPNCSLHGNISFCAQDQHPHFEFFIRNNDKTSQQVLLSLSCIDAFTRHRSKWKVTPLSVFSFYLINFTTMSVLMMCQWNCPMLGTLAKWWLVGGVDPIVIRKVSFI